MPVTIPKIVALLIALGYLIAAILIEHPSAGAMLMLVSVLLVPLVLIWFPEVGISWPRRKTILGTYDDRDRLSGPTGWRDSPPGLVVFMGWFFLIGMPLLLYWIWQQ
jgi:hypothetical protein